MAKLPLWADRMLTAASKILVDLPVTYENAYEDAERNDKQICEMLKEEERHVNFFPFFGSSQRIAAAGPGELFRMLVLFEV